MTIPEIAKVCHEVNRAYCQALGDNSQPSWSEAPTWQIESACKGVKFHLDNSNALPSHSHDCWLEERRATGWTYGPVKDPDKKQHPCFVPYSELSKEQQAKDYIFKAVVTALAQFVTDNQ